MSTYYGEEKCTGTLAKGGPCRNMGYYLDKGKVRCGVHSSKTSRTKLPVNPEKKANEEKVLSKHFESVVEKALEQEGNGKVILTKMRMMRKPEFVSGYLNVFPNFLHQTRKDGFGCSSLSPKSMGPIDHGQPGLPIALNLENFHQGNKVFPSEVDEKGEPSATFFETQRKMYLDAKPHRHKAEAKGKNIPAFSVWVDKDGKRHKLTYFESRQFYSHFYERIAKDLPDFQTLQEKLRQGYNLNICGYDAYMPQGSIEECYLDTSRPFGHELVLYTMLVFPENEWPWRKYKQFDF